MVLQVQGGEGAAEEKGALAKLGALLASLVDEPGLLVVSDVKNDGAGVTPTDWIFELAGGGLIPASGGKAPLSFFEPTGFVAYLQKCSFSIANPRGKDLDALQALDEESWIEALRYSRDAIEAWVSRKGQDILVCTDGASGDIIGAMYTQRVKDGEVVDKMGWRESIFGSDDRTIDKNVDPKGMVKQLLRVSTKKGGAGGGVGSTLRDFALAVAASQGISSVVSALLLVWRSCVPFMNPRLTLCLSPFAVASFSYQVCHHACQRFRH